MCVCFHEQVMGGGLLSSRMDEPAHTATTSSFIFDIFFSLPMNSMNFHFYKIAKKQSGDDATD